MLKGSRRACSQFLVKTLSFIASLVLAAAPLVGGAHPAHAQSSSKISPALLAQITANPLQRVPVIVEMNAPSLPFSTPVNTGLAQQAVSILNANGQAVGGLPIVSGAAGYANLVGV